MNSDSLIGTTHPDYDLYIYILYYLGRNDILPVDRSIYDDTLMLFYLLLRMIL